MPDQRHLPREARGSVYEIQTQIEIAMRLQFIAPADGARLLTLADDVGRMINRLVQSMTDSRDPRNKA